MAKLWDVEWRGKRIATVHNTLSAGLGTHQPDLAAIRDALPLRYRGMRVSLWSYRAPIGESESATVTLYGKNGDPVGTCYCRAYEFA